MNPRNFAIASGVLVLGVAGILFFGGGGGGGEQINWGLHIVVFDVGQADAIAMVSPDGQACVIDAGNTVESGKRVAQFLLSETENGVGALTEVKLGFATHYDKDHIGGFLALVEEGISFNSMYDQGSSLKREDPIVTSAYGKYIEAAGDTNRNLTQDSFEDSYVRKTARVGLHWKLGDAKIRCVSARGDTRGSNHDLPNRDPSVAKIDENPGSIALYITLGEFEFYTAGDQTSDDWQNKPDTEMSVINSGVLGDNSDIDVLKVNHHGSDTSTGQEFVQALDPEVAIITAKHGTHHLPRMISIMQLIENSAKVFITGDGIDPATGTFSYSNQTNDDNGYLPDTTMFVNNAGDVHIYVSADGNSYKVVYGDLWEEYSSVDADNSHEPIM